jgi:hypothetical protein
MTYDENNAAMNTHALERDVRAIPGVVACTVTNDATSVLIDPAADWRSIDEQLRPIIARHGGPGLHLLIPGAVRAPRRAARPRFAFAVLGASAAMAAAVVPLSFRSVPHAPPLQLRQAPAAAEPSTIVATHASAAAPASPRAPVIRVAARTLSGGTSQPTAPVAVPRATTAPRQVPGGTSAPDAPDCNGHYAYGYDPDAHPNNGKHLGHTCINEERRP